jgi:hypothetical protein
LSLFGGGLAVERERETEGVKGVTFKGQGRGEGTKRLREQAERALSAHHPPEGFSRVMIICAGRAPYPHATHRGPTAHI